MDIHYVRANKFYEYEKYSYVRHFKKRDILRHVSFDNYTDFVTEAKKFAKDKLINIDIQHEICVNGKIFKITGPISSMTLAQMDAEVNVFDVSFEIPSYVDDNGLTIELYIKKSLLREFLAED